MTSSKLVLPQFDFLEEFCFTPHELLNMSAKPEIFLQVLLELLTNLEILLKCSIQKMEELKITSWKEGRPIGDELV